jgi:allantoinase
MTAFPQRFLLVKAQNAILSAKHTQAPAEVLIDHSTGKIVEIALENKKCTTVVSEGDLEVIELEDNQLLMPGLVDAHGKEKVDLLKEKHVITYYYNDSSFE